MVFVDACFLSYPAVKLAAIKATAFPERIKYPVDVLASLFEFLRRDAAKRLCSVARLVVAADEVSASIALPERKLMKVRPVRIDLTPIRETSIDFSVASAAMDLHVCSVCFASSSAGTSRRLAI